MEIKINDPKKPTNNRKKIAISDSTIEKYRLDISMNILYTTNTKNAGEADG